jgi:hypothetical protein
MPNPSHRCLLCGTQYFAPGVCDWDGVELTKIPFQLNPPPAYDEYYAATKETEQGD